MLTERVQWCIIAIAKAQKNKYLEVTVMFESTISVDMRNTMKAEAVKCMGILKLDKRCIKAFEKGNVWMMRRTKKAKDLISSVSLVLLNKAKGM